MHPCRRFFEAIYSSLLAVLDEAFERLRKHAAIEQELGKLFRWDCRYSITAVAASCHPSHSHPAGNGIEFCHYVTVADGHLNQ